MTATKLDPDGHSTNPPARFTEASLIKTLEELGIGRPSTYASIIKTILDRGYVYKRGSALVPSWVAFAVIGLLEAHFAQLVDYDFTAGMEDDLDEIAAGQEQRSAWLSRFYFGGEHGDEDSVARKGGLKKLVGQNLEDIDAREINSIRLFDDAEGREIHVRVGRFGPYLERMVVDPDNPDGDLISQRANLPEDLPPDELTLEYAEKLFSTPQEGRVLGVDPATGHEIVAREGRFGPYVTELLPEPKPEPEPEPDVTPVPVEELTSGGATKTATKTAAKKAAKKAPAKKATKKATGPKPRTASLLKTMELSSVTLDDACGCCHCRVSSVSIRSPATKSPRRTVATVRI